MKRSLFVVAALIFGSFALNAQEEMEVAWTKSYDHKGERVGTGLEGEGEVSYTSDSKTMTVFNTSDGSVVWSKDFKDLAPKLRKVDELIPFWKSGCVFLFEKKGGKDQIVVIDLKKGEMLWNTEKYKNLTRDNVIYIKETDAFLLSLEDRIIYIHARTGEEVWESTAFVGSVGAWDIRDGYMTAMNILPTGLSALFKGFKNQIAKIDLSNGDIVWTNEYIGFAARKVITKERIFDLKITENKVVITLNGLQVYDFNTGAQLWSAAYPETPKVIGAPAGAKAFGVYGAIADPLRVGDDIYIIEMNKKSDQKIKKYDVHTGKLLWTSPEIKNAKALPNLYVVEDRVIVQIGGVVETQAYIRRKTQDGWEEEWIVDYVNVKPNGLQAFSTEDGSLVWASEKFKKGITNAFVDNDILYVSSGKSIYSMNYKDGAVNFEEDVKNGGVGNAVKILPYKDKIVVVGEKGISTFAMKDGSLLNANKYKKAAVSEQEDNILLMVTPKNDFAAFNLEDCSYREYNAKKNSQQSLSEDGRFVWVYEKKDVTKLKVR